MPRKTLIILVVVGLAGLALWVKANFNAKKFQKSFRDEMAQRLDLEEKLTKMENERSSLQTELKVLQHQLKSAKAELDELQKQLAKEQEEKAALVENVSVPSALKATR